MTRPHRVWIFGGMLAAFLIAGSVVAFFPSKPSALIPRDALFSTPEYSEPQLSPDGSLVAFLTPYENVPNVGIYDPGNKTRRVLTRDKDKGISFYVWTPDGKAVVFRKANDSAGNSHLYRIDLSGGEAVDLTPFEKVHADIFRGDRDRSGKILLTLNKEDAARRDLYRLDLGTGALKLVERDAGRMQDWIADPEMNVRGAVAARPDGGLDLLVRDHEKSEWKKILAWDFEDAVTCDVVGFSKNGKEIFLLDSRGTDTARLVRMDLATGRSTTLFSDPHYDVDEASISPADHEPDMVSVVRDRQSWIGLKDTVRHDLDGLRKVRPGDVSVVSRTKDDKIWIILFNNDISPYYYYICNRSDNTIKFLFTHRPALLKYRLLPMEPVAFLSRDGLPLSGYLTLPAGKKKPSPMVLLVHGGPWTRDRWRFDPLAQWLANRGYACLQVNFRGSKGFGKKFLNAGNKEWGRKMQDDLTDAVAWAVREGIADPARVGIMGASYGGYAALAGAAFNQEIFRCAVDQFGPSDLAALIRAMPAFWAAEKDSVLKRVGDPDTEAAILKERSPLYAADKIRIPLLIAQGAHDAQTPRSESDRMVEALRKKNIECEYWVFPDEGHGFLKQENRLKFYRAVEAFLARHLGGRSEP